MPTDLRSITDFDGLLAYLGSELDWPVEDYTREELTFEYDADELGLKDEEVAKLSNGTIQQLRPLQGQQPFGIFFVEFDHAKLPIVVLRRILSQLVIKKRSSANSAEAKRWDVSDLIFISAFGEEEHREIAFAHFHSDPETTDLPVLRVLGWHGEDTHLKSAAVAKTLKNRLSWPEDDGDQEAWRQQWRSAFKHKPGHTISTSKELATAMAGFARRIRDAARAILPYESENGRLRKLYKGFQDALIHDLSEEDFTTYYAETICYGLFTVAVSKTELSEGKYGTAMSADDVAHFVPVTNPFLKEMLWSFLEAGGRNQELNFDDLGINEIVSFFNSSETDLPAVIRDFGSKRPGEDPVIHLYEDFLKQFDAELRKKRGVYYTPKPVVSYIVRSVHELLQTEFGLSDGLADTTTWGEMLGKHAGLEFPTTFDDKNREHPISRDEPFVQILDPATGTATFLVEVIEVIHMHLVAKWKQEGLTVAKQLAAWNDYVPKHLLPRLHGYELMMAPYAIAHMKIGLKLAETGYRFGSEERARIYLTNALEPWLKQLPLIGFDALAREAEEVNKIKRQRRFTVLIGNPPYSKESQNMGEQYSNLIERFRIFSKKRIREPGAILFERDINNDYVKFFGLNRNIIELSRSGVIGLITSSSYLDGKNFRGVRDALTESFNAIRILNLHGDSRSGALARQGVNDENIFSIETGVSIMLATRTATPAQCKKFGYSEVIGNYALKSKMLLESDPSLRASSWTIDDRRYKTFVPSESSMLDEYSAFKRLDETLRLKVDGIKTSRDGLVIANSASECARKIQAFMNFTASAEDMKEEFRISVKKWNYKSAQNHLRKNFSEERIYKVAYRPFDFRYIYYDSELVFSNREAKMSHMIRGENLALVCASRLSSKGFSHILPADCLVEMKYASHDTNSAVFPALSYDDLLSNTVAQPNVGRAGVEIMGYPANKSSWMDFNAAMLAVLNSTVFRTRYVDEIKNDFPGIPPMSNISLTQKLTELGKRLICAQLLQAKVPDSEFPFNGKIGGKIEGARHVDNSIYLSETANFSGVSIEIFNFNLAGYQVCKNWVTAGKKSGIQRKGTLFTEEHCQLYRKVLFGIQETIAIRRQIDKVIETHGGWPGAFSAQDSSAKAAKP